MMSDLDALDFGYSIDEVIEGRAAFEKKKEIKMEKYSKLDGWTQTHSVHFNFTTKDATVAYDIAAQLEEIINNNRDKFTGHSVHMDSSHLKY